MCKGTEAWGSMGAWEMCLKHRMQEEKITEKEVGSMLWETWNPIVCCHLPCYHPRRSLIFISPITYSSEKQQGQGHRVEGWEPTRPWKKKGGKTSIAQESWDEVGVHSPPAPRFRGLKTECGTFGRRSEEIIPAEMGQGLGTLCMRINSHLRDVGLKRVEGPAWDPEREKLICFF